ncbi:MULTISPECIES: hypothetical protein [Mediterraneibacter]|jgi:hypothetical protein|uniref:hypothetical protein n=1 Tax=Mediterraneibacter TaxID=2316020 RepID=UPI000E4FB88C|nr:hypothetical protein [Mediterraneibacter massiliensis]RGT73091.1 hypothetical protein DWX08_07635 [Ruminococcus sp. AF18-22]
MEETYWSQFMLTGSVEDYLQYRWEKSKKTGQTSNDKWGVECESNCVDRDGAVRSADRRI